MSPAPHLQQRSIISHHLQNLKSPVRPLVLPYYAEAHAQAFAAATSREPTPDRVGPRSDVEIYFDVAAGVGSQILSCDSESENGWIDACSSEDSSSSIL